METLEQTFREFEGIIGGTIGRGTEERSQAQKKDLLTRRRNRW